MTTKVWAKAKWYIGTKTAALAAESSWTQVKGARVSSGTFGKEWKTTDDSVMEDGFTSMAKTIFDGGNLELTVKRVIADPGQIALKAACDDPSDAVYNFKLELNDNPGGAGDSPTTYKFQALVTSFSGKGPNTSNINEFSSKLDIEGEIIEADAVDAA
jgi:hypothetical protein